jgi:hypothetical protein
MESNINSEKFAWNVHGLLRISREYYTAYMKEQEIAFKKLREKLETHVLYRTRVPYMLLFPCNYTKTMHTFSKLAA